MSQCLLQKPESRKTRTAQQPEHDDMLTKKLGDGLQGIMMDNRQYI